MVTPRSHKAAASAPRLGSPQTLLQNHPPLQGSWGQEGGWPALAVPTLAQASLVLGCGPSRKAGSSGGKSRLMGKGPGWTESWKSKPCLPQAPQTHGPVQRAHQTYTPPLPVIHCLLGPLFFSLRDSQSISPGTKPTHPGGPEHRGRKIGTYTLTTSGQGPGNKG